MPKVACCGTKTDHGVPVITCSDFVFCGSKGIARVGDEIPPHLIFHPQSPIVEGSDITFIEGRSVARVGDKCQCGAELIEDGSCDITYSN